MLRISDSNLVNLHHRWKSIERGPSPISIHCTLHSSCQIQSRNPTPRLRLWGYSRKSALYRHFWLQHLVVKVLLNFCPNAPSSGRFYKLANPVYARVKKFWQSPIFNCIPSASDIVVSAVFSVISEQIGENMLQCIWICICKYLQGSVKIFLAGSGNCWLNYCAIVQFWGGQRNILTVILKT